MIKYGKNYKKAAEALKAKPSYSLSESIKMFKEGSSTKFDSTAELHLNLNIDSKQADQTIRSTIVLPHGTGRSIKIAAVVPEDKVKAAMDAGATAAGLEEMIVEFEKGKFKYDVIVATPDVMKQLAKVAKVLGQKGLMPNPKSGTVTSDVEKTIAELTKGRIELRNDKDGNLHTVFGKASFKQEELENNLTVVLQTIRDSKPSGVKGTFINSITISGTMGPGIKLGMNEVMSELPK